MNHEIRISSEVSLEKEQEVFQLITSCALQVLASVGVDFRCE